MRKIFTDEIFEKSIPRWLSEGLRAKDIATLIGVSLSTLHVKCSERKVSLRPPPKNGEPQKRPEAAWVKSAAVRACCVDYRLKTTMPIRDMHRDGRIVFLVDIYGWTGKDVCVIPGGSEPMRKAVERLGLDPNRYQAILWDARV